MPHPTALASAHRALRAWAIACVLAVIGLTLPASAAQAAPRAFTNSYADTLHGDIATVGNANSTCRAAWTACTPGALGNHNSNEGYGALVDIDGAAVNTTNSSSATLNLPAGAIVRSARLVWGSAGDGTDGNGENTVRLDTPLTPGFAYAGVSAGTACGSIANTNGANTRGFACSADVTSTVAAAGSGAYTVGAIEQRATTGGDLPDHWSGWNLYVVFELASEPLRRLVLSDGFQRVQTGASTTIDATGFTAPASGTVSARLIYSVGEGDSGIAGDNATFGSRSLDTTTPIDLMESSIRGLAPYESGRAPSNTNHYGFDLHADEINGAIANGAQTAAFVFNTTQDVYYPFSLGIAIELGEPNLVLTKTLTDVNGGVVEPGDVIEYQVVAVNEGNDGAALVTVTDPVPGGTTYVPGSLRITTGAGAGAKTDAADGDQGTFSASTGPRGQVAMRLGTGATGTAGGVLAAGGTAAPGGTGTSTMTFRVRIDPNVDEGVSLVNTASGSYIGQTSRLSYADPSSVAATPVRRSDMVVGQALSPGMTNGQAGTVTLTASNIGGAQTYGQPVTVTTTIPAGVAIDGVGSAPGWSCTVTGQLVTCTRSDVLTAASAYPPIVLNVTPGQTATGASFTAQVAGGNEVRTNNNTATGSTTFVREANLRIVKAADLASARVGDTITYTLVARNLGPSNTTGVTVTDPLPATLQPLSASATQGTCATAGQTVSCAVGALASGASANVTITARVLAAAVSSTVTNSASIAGPDPDPTPANNSASTSTAVGQAADLSVSKSVSPAAVNPGTNATWTIQVRNDGPGSAPAVELTDDLPGGLTVGSVTASQGTCAAATPGSAFTCALGTIASGATATVTIVARPTLAAAGTTLTNLARATTTAWDPTPANDGASSPLTVRPAADVSITKTSDRTDVDVDGLITWTLTAANAGPSAASGVVMTDQIPSGITITAINAPSGTSCSVLTAPSAPPVVNCAVSGSLASGQSRVVTITGRVARASAGSPLTNSARATLATYDPDLANNLSEVTSSVNRAADLRVAKTADRATARVGETITWTVTARNDGASAATNVVLTDTLPAGVTLTGAAPSVTPGGPCAVSGSIVSCAIGTLAVGASATLVLTARVERAAAETPLQNMASVSGSEFDPDTANNTTNVSSPVPATADLAITKAASHTAREVGEPLTYTLTARNDGPSTATNAVVTDTLPVGFTLGAVPTVTGGTCAVAGRTVTCTFPTLASGAARTITLAGQVAPGGAGTTLSNTAEITGNQVDQDPANNATPPVTTTVAGVAELAIAKSVDRATAVVGDTLTYTLTVRNTGPQASTGTTLTDTLPAGLTRLGATASQGSCAAGSPIACALGTIPVGGTATVTITARVGLGAAESTATNTASVRGDLNDLTPADDTASASTTIAPAADLRIVKTADRATADVGDTITWTLTATNDGPSAATGVTVNDTIPAGVTLATPITGLPAGVTCAPSGQVVACTIAGSLASGASRAITLRAVVRREAAETPLENVATIAGGQLDPDTANNTSRVTTTVGRAADLRVAKTVNVATADVGDTLAWTVSVTNDGPSIATGVQLIDDLPAGTTLLTRSATQGTCTQAPASGAATQVLCAVGTLAPGQTATLTITSRVERSRAESPVANAARATANELDPDTANNLSTATTTVGPSTDLQLTATVDRPTANVGETVAYEVVVRNDGPSTATGVVMTDTLPAGLVRTGPITTSGGGACTATGQAISCPVGTLPNGGAVTIRFSAVVQAAAGASTLTNSAAVSGAQPDPTPADNTASVVTSVPGAADVAVVTSVDRATAGVGDTLTFAFTARNDGPQAATGFSLQGAIPTGLTVLSSSAPGLACSGSAPVSCTGTLAPGAVATLTVTARVGLAASGQSLTALGTVAASPFDPVPANNVDDAVTTIRPAADLRLTKTADRTSANLGDLITYTLTATNAGPAAATGVTVTDTLPASLQLVGTPTSSAGACIVAGRDVTCTPSALASGASATITIVGRVLAAAAGTTVANTATVDGDQDDPTPANNDTPPTSTTVAGAADVAVVTSVSRATVDVGETATFTFAATNNGPQTATGFSLQGALPPGFTVVGTPSVTGGLACSGTAPVSCTGTLADGASATLTVVGRAGVAASGTTGPAVGTVSATPFDAVPANNASSTPVTTRPAADLRATKTVDRPAADIGDTLVYTLRASNDGPAAATGVTLTDTLPATLEPIGTPTASQGTCTVSGQTITCASGSVASGASATATIRARVLAAASGTTVSNTASVDGDQFDPTAGNDTSDPATTSVGAVADVRVVTSVDQATANVGETLTYTFAATNAGPQPAAGFVLQGTIPPGAVIVGTPTVTGGLSCTGTAPITCAGTLPVGGTATLTVRASLPLSASGTTATATGVVSATPFDPIAANNASTAAATIRLAADLRATKTADRATANIGDTITYTLTAANAGPANATGVTLTDTLPGTLQILGTPTASQGTCSVTGQAVSCAVGAIAGGASATATITARVLPSAAASSIANTASVSGAQFDPAPGNDTSAAVSTSVGQVADVAVVAAVDRPVANIGETLTYTFVATNNGPQTAAGLQLVGTLPAGLTVLSQTAPGLTCSGSPIACTGSLASGASATLTVTARVDAGASGQSLTAQGAVSSSVFDPVSANDASTAAATIRPAADLRATKTVDRSTANVGDTLTYTLTAANAGPAGATGVTLTDTLPSGLQLVGTPTASQGTCTASGRTVTCAVGAIAGDASATATITARVLAGAAASTVANAATVAGAQFDPAPANDASTPATTVVAPVADVAVTTTVDAPTASVGELLTYTFAARNDGPQTAAGFTLTGTLPAGVTIVGTPSATGGLSCTGSPVTCSGTLASGATATLTVQARVLTAASGQTLAAQGTVATTTFDPVAANNTSGASTTIRPAADLRITKTADRPSANIGELITYSLTATNDGPAAATGVTLTDTLPATLQLVGAPSATPGTCTVSGQAVTCVAGTLASGASATATITARVLPAAAGASIANTASVDGDQTDPTPGNDTSTPTTTTIGAAADVAVVTSVSAPTADVGDTLTYTFTARNDGPQAATGFTLQGAIPAGLTVLTSSAPGLSCSGTAPVGCTGTLAPGAVATLTVTARVGVAASGQALTALGTVSATPFDPVPANNVDDAATTIRPAADLRLVKTADRATANIGETITFALRAFNDGPGAATGVTITDTLPSTLQVVGTPTSTQGGCAVAGQVITCSIGALGAGANATATLVTRVRPAAASSSVSNVATVDGDQTDPTPANDTSAPTSTAIAPAADLAVTQTVSDPTINLGDTVDYVVTVRNAGPQAATGVVLSNDLPTGGTVVSVTPSQGTCGAGDPFSCALGTLASGATATITVRVQIVGAASSTFSNVASVTATQFDPALTNNSATVGTSTSPAADLRVVKTADRTAANVGETITWTVTATNDGPSPATGVTITDTVPAGVTLQPVTAPAGASCAVSGRTVTCTRPAALGVGDTLAVTLRGVVERSAAGTPLANAATVSGAEFDPDTADNLSEVTTDVAAAADLRIAKAVDRATANVGDTLTWTLVVANDGPSTATAVVGTDTLPAGVTLLSRTASQGTCAPAGGQVVCAIGALAGGASATITLTGRVERSAAESPVDNTATVTSSVFDPNPADNLSTTSTSVGPAADLRLSKAVDRATADVGETLTYTLVATNDGPSQATGAAITDTLPSGLALVGTPATTQGACSVTGQTVSCSVGTLASGASATVTITATVRLAAAASSLANTASITGTRLDPDPANNATPPVTTAIRPAADLVVTHAVDRASLNLGDTAEFAVTVRNTGPSTATGVQLADTLPAGTTLVSRSTSGGSCAAGGNPLRCALGSIAPGGSVTVTVRLRLESGASATFTSSATATATEFDPTPADNTASASTATGPSADLRLVKTSDRATANVGDTITWTLTARNDGPSAATGVTITDTLPAGVTGVTATAPAGVTCTIAAGTASCAVPGPWASGTERVVTLRGEVARSSAGSPLRNAASIAGAEFDPGLTDNVSEVTTTVDAAADLRVAKTADRATANVGDTITWTVTATNDGPSAAPAVSITDDLPAGVALLSATSPLGSCATVGRQVVCGPGALASGASAAATITARVEVVAAESPLVNAARVTSPTFDPDAANNLSSVSTSVGKSVDLRTTAAVDRATANVGDELTYTFVVSDAGPSSATSATFTHALPAGVTLLSQTATQGGCSTAGSDVRCALGTIAAGAAATVTVRVRVDSAAAGTTIEARGGVTATEPDRAPANDLSPTVSTAIAPAADLAVTTTADRPTAAVGDLVTYLVTVTNRGPSTATGVRLTNALPAGAAVVSVTPSAGVTCDTADPRACAVGTLAPNASATLSVVVRTTPANAGALVTDRASAAADQFDPTPADNTAQASAAVGDAADLRIVKTADRATAEVGDTITWTLTATNLGPMGATGVAVTDAIPAGVTITSVTPAAGGAACTSGSPVACTLGSLASGASTTITVVGRVDRTAAGSPLAGQATVTGDQLDPNPANNVSASTVNVGPAADLRVAKLVDRTSPAIGERVTWTIQVVNDGPQAAVAAQVTDVVPAGAPVESVSSNAGTCARTGQRVVCDLGTLASGTSATVTITARVASSAGGAVLDNAATASSGTRDPDPANNTATARATAGASADLSVTLTPDRASATVGERITWTAVVGNGGPQPATGVALTTTLPAGLENVTATGPAGSTCTVDGRTVTCVLADLPVGQSASIALSGTAGRETAERTLEGAAVVAGALPDPNPADNTAVASVVTVPAAVDLVVTKTADRENAGVGEQVTITTDVLNRGPSAATEVVLTDTLPEGATLVSVTPSQGTCTVAGRTITCDLGTIADGQRVSIGTVVRIDVAGADQQLLNAGVASSGQFDTDGANNVARISTGGQNPPAGRQPAPQLELTKVVDKTAVTAGSPVVFTLTATNTGNAPASGVRIVDALPAGLDYVSTKAAGATCSRAARTITCVVASLAPGRSVSVKITTTVASVGAPIENVATVTAAGLTDPAARGQRAGARVQGSGAPFVVAGIKPLEPFTRPGKTVRIAVKVTNVGAATANDVRGCFTLPRSVVLLRRPAGLTQRGAQFCLSAARLADGQAKRVILRARVVGSAGSSRPKITGTSSNSRVKTEAYPIVVRGPRPTRAAGVTG